MPSTQSSYQELEQMYQQLVRDNLLLKQELIKMKAADRRITFLEVIPQMVSYINRALEYEYVNKAYEKTFKVASQEIIGQKLEDFIGKEAMEKAQKHIDMVFNGQQVNYFEEYHYPNNNTRYIEGNLLPDFDINGMVTGYWAILNDVTDKIKSENALRKSEEKYRSIFNNAPLGIFRSTPKGRFLEMNQALADMIGYETPEQAISSIADIAKDIYVKTNERKTIVSQIISQDNYQKFENVYKRKDGSLFTANLYIKAVKNSDGKVSHLEGIVEDITEIIEAENCRKKIAGEAAYIERKIKLLRKVEMELNNTIKSNDYDFNKFKPVLTLFKNELEIDRHWQIFKENFESLHSGFFKKLYAISTRLSQQDIKHCAFIKMNFETKEIASMFNVKPASVQMSRVRLKKKLGLNKDEDLIRFIHGL
jgi:PAS domain S-box-containing protein